LVRAAALDALLAVPPGPRAELAEPLANDGVKAVRVRAGRALVALPPNGLSAVRRTTIERAVAEYVASEEAVAERPEAHLNLGIFFGERADVPRAETEYRLAMRRQPDFVPAYANLADLYRAAGRDADAAATLADGLTVVPDEPSLLHALGLTRVREGRAADGVALLGRASRARPQDARFAYVYAVALHSAGRPEDAVAVLEKALGHSPYDTDLLFGLATFSGDAGRLPDARRYAERLAAVAPADPRAVGLLRQLGRAE
jgi:tetratricopeptide (TPR) repeat protein